MSLMPPLTTRLQYRIIPSLHSRMQRLAMEALKEQERCFLEAFPGAKTTYHSKEPTPDLLLFESFILEYRDQVLLSLFVVHKCQEFDEDTFVAQIEIHDEVTDEFITGSSVCMKDRRLLLESLAQHTKLVQINAAIDVLKTPHLL